MKKITTTLLLLMMIQILLGANKLAGKGPVIIEASTKYAKIDEALKATKAELLTNQFILKDGMQEKSFSALKTTGSQADYYVAEVEAELIEGKVKIKITFIKVGTGLLKLQKVADEIKAKLESN